VKAVVCPKYGPPEVLRLAEVEEPVPASNEVRIRVRSSAVTASDIFIRGSQIPIRFRIPMRVMIGLRRPRRSVIGLVLAGDVESVGSDTRRFRPGDRVYGLTGFGLGAYAEYKCMAETDSVNGGLALMPANLSYEEATAVAYGGLLALQFMEKADVQRGQKVLVYGASSTSGTIAVQYAKYLGAEVTAVCSRDNLQLAALLGADRLIDYTTQHSLDPWERFDLVFDAVGKAKTSKLKEECKKALTPQGTYASIDGGRLLLDSKRLDHLRRLVEAGHIRPVLDKCYPLEEIVEAHRYVGAGHKKGGVAITIAHADNA
jgi:NADPH:quinone reductase-like Zn-dependent oxidoreductase